MNWKEIYDRESPALYTHLLVKGCNPHLAEDIVQEVFLGAISAGAVLEHPRAYLFQAARNALARNGLKNPHVEISPLIIDEQPDDEFRAEDVNAALSRLPEEQREVVALHVWSELTFREIGGALGLSLDTVASRWRYGIGKLRMIMKKG